ncbi:hypothetical protein MNQ98_02445 [Paenibacillus sp. N3/727]|uniref:hypothetical protein n=1 Tax=Paenibacillus sp. N3/727 TaxID=2925845 RepID=UPI001F534B0A|nr:hypothetical protein [Paenibacillus sp. N3/727]UNK18927.1 hypothetical protein MNQ98_02445 [Paenibacillus sp. N3/727]
MKPPIDMERKLRQFMASLTEYPYYRALRDVQHWSDLPVTDKALINEKRELFELPHPGKVYESFTSGTTGIPFRCVKTIEERWRLAISIYRHRKKWGLPPKHQMLLLSNRSLSEPHHLDYYANQLQRQHFHMIQGRASALVSLAQHIFQKNMALPSSLLFVQNWGEPVHASQKHEIERVFRVPLVDYYGLEEIWCIAFSNQLGQLEIDEDSVYVEVLEPGTNMPVQDGTYGEIVVTSFLMRSIPYVRYRTGDIGRTRRNEYGARIVELFPVRNAQIKLPGREIHSSIFRYLDKFFYELAQNEQIKQFQVVQESHTEFRLLIVGSISEEQRLRTRLEKFLQQSLRAEVSLTIERKDQIPLTPNGKLQSFISLVNDNAQR